MRNQNRHEQIRTSFPNTYSSAHTGLHGHAAHGRKQKYLTRPECHWKAQEWCTKEAHQDVVPGNKKERDDACRVEKTRKKDDACAS